MKKGLRIKKIIMIKKKMNNKLLKKVIINILHITILIINLILIFISI